MTSYYGFKQDLNNNRGIENILKFLYFFIEDSRHVAKYHIETLPELHKQALFNPYNITEKYGIRKIVNAVEHVFNSDLFCEYVFFRPLGSYFSACEGNAYYHKMISALNYNIFNDNRQKLYGTMINNVGRNERELTLFGPNRQKLDLIEVDKLIRNRLKDP